jgi:hypothetical protein
MHIPRIITAAVSAAGLTILLLQCVLAQSGGALPEPAASWRLDTFEKTAATDRISGIHDAISNRFHYSPSADGALYRYPTHVVRKAEHAPPLQGPFTVTTWIAVHDGAGHWMPILDQGMAPPVDKSALGGCNRGLLGVKYGDSDLSRPIGDEPLSLMSLDNDWREGDNSWSCTWRGYMQAPADGEIRFYAEADDGARVSIDGAPVIDMWDDGGSGQGAVVMAAGRWYPIRVSYYRDGGVDAYLRL